MSRLLHDAFILFLCAVFSLLAGERADSDLAAIKDHFAKTSADFDRSQSNWVWVFYGDSITHGCHHTDGWRNFVEIIEERIRWEKAALFDTIINSGNSGYSSTHLVNPPQYDWQVRSHHPRVVALLIGGNDIVLPDASIERFRKNLQTLVENIRADGAIAVLQTYHTMKLFENPQNVWQSDYARRYHEIPEYNQVIREVAMEKDVILVDHEKYWQENAADPSVHDFWMAEHIHPGARGHQELARLFLQTLGMDKGGQSQKCLSLEAGGPMPQKAPASQVNDNLQLFTTIRNWKIDSGPEQFLDKKIWQNTYSPGTATLANTKLLLDHLGGKDAGKAGMFHLLDTEKLQTFTGKFLLEIEMRILPDLDPLSNRFYVGFKAGQGNGVGEAIFILAPSVIDGSCRACYSMKPDEFFKFRVLIDTANKKSFLWVNNKLLGTYAANILTDAPPFLSFGNGSSSIGGKSEILRIRATDLP